MIKMPIMRGAVVGLIFLMAFSGNTVIAGQPLETETARLLTRGEKEIEFTSEYQTSSEGKELALPLLFGLGITDRLELTVEPTAFAKISPKRGPRASGAGDIEATITYLVSTEKPVWPALALAAEIKAPTAKNRLIGSGKTDYAGYLIASKAFQLLDIHANLGYTILGKPAGVLLNNIFSFALAAEYHFSPKWEVLCEGFANTSAEPGQGEGTDGQTNPNAQTAELSGGESFGMIGMRYQILKSTTFCFGLVYDNTKALLFRPGLTFNF